MTVLPCYAFFEKATCTSVFYTDLYFLALGGNSRLRVDGFCNKRIGTNDRIFTVNCISAQNGRTGINGNMILNGGMTPLAPQILPSSGRERTQGHTLVDFDMIANNSRLANYDTRTVIDKEVFSHGSAGVDIDTGDRVGMFGHNARDHGYTHTI